MLDILRHNTGFDEPWSWVGYAAQHGFRAVRARKVDRCPDCSSEPCGAHGQYVYYSTLVHLLECAACGLIWADAHIDPLVLRAHFEIAYKEDRYFREGRAPIFRHLAGVIDELAGRRARVLDIGGARGDLMHEVVRRRPDLRVVVHDVSTTATTFAATRFGLPTLTADTPGLASHPGRYDVVVLSDVLYYEPDLRMLWLALSRLIRPGGAFVARVPNKLLLMRITRAWRKRDRIPFFNPEHVHILGRRYLSDRLRGLGFARVRALPSPLLATGVPASLSHLSHRLAEAAHRLSGGSLLLTPSMLVVGTGRRAVAALHGRDRR